MSNKDNIEIEISTADVNLTSEMDVQPTQISQIDEADTPVSYTHLDVYKRQVSLVLREVFRRYEFRYYLW